MANELPYLKFYVAAWLLGRISHEKDAIKGRFSDAFSHYWHKECVITQVELEKKMGKTRLNSLIKLEYIKVIDGLVSIPFLDEQWSELSGLKAKRSAAGSKGRQAQLGQTPDKKTAQPGHLEQNRGEQKRTEESYKENLPEQNSWIRVGTKTVPLKPSEYYQQNCQMSFESWSMNNPNDKHFAPSVFKRMDAEYTGYDFSDDNHVKRTFLFVLQNIKGGKPAATQENNNVYHGSFFKNK